MLHMNTFMKNYIRKVNKAMTFLVLMNLAVLVYFIITKKQPILFAVGGVDVAIMAFLVFSQRKKRFELLSAYIVPVMITIICLLLIGKDTGYIHMILLPIALAVLYLYKPIFLTVVGLADVGFIIKHIIDPIGKDFITDLMLINLIVVILFFAVHWGSRLINLAASENKKAEDHLTDLNRVLDTIRESSDNLNKDITECNHRLKDVWNDSAGMLKTVEEVAKGVMEQAEAITEINDMMSNAEQKMVETQNNSSLLSEISAKASDVVANGSGKINQMGQQMTIISQTTTDTLSTVQVLKEQMAKVVSFLSSISNIAEQTNMLSLNAAIEAARAGESGKGFAVVADEVRKLAEQSASAVRQIDEIVSEINEKTANVMDKVQKGKTATEEGEKIVVEVSQNFEDIRESFKRIDDSVVSGLAIVDETSAIFTKVRQEAESIASISQEHTASTEEMLATMENQSANIEKTSIAMMQINSSSEKLQSIAYVSQ
jgi:methyl-accepting chemotaxis protein